MATSKKSTYILIYSELSNKSFFTDFYSDKDFRARVISSGDYGSEIFINNFFEAVVVDGTTGGWEEKDKFINSINSVTPWMPIIIVASDDVPQINELACRKGVITVISEDIKYNKLKNIISTQIEQRREAINKVFVIPENFNRYNSLLDFINSEMSGDDTEEIMCAVARRITEEFPSMITAFLEVNHSNSFYCCSDGKISTEFSNSLKRKTYDLINDIGKNKITFNNINDRIEFLTEKTLKDNLFQYLCSIPVFEDNRLTGLLSISANRSSSSFSESETIVIFALMRQLCLLLRTFNKIRSKMIHDSLSGLYDHQYFQRALKLSVESAIDNNECVSLILLDIDRFKNFNDSYGHIIGDEVIKDFADLVSGYARENDIVGRFGGDEFAIILPDTDFKTAKLMSQKLLEAVRGHIFKNCGHPLSFTASIGMATTKDAGINNSSSLFEAADAAVFLAKKNGRNQLCCNHEMSQSKSPVREAAKIIGKSFKKEEPVIDGKSGRVMIVDDNVDILNMLKTLLMKKNFDVRTACNGNTALETVREEHENIDLIISDINMPGMNGLDLVHAVREIDPNLVIILLTGFATVTNSMSALKAGAFRIIKKPFDFEELTNTVETGVERCLLKRRLDAYHLHLEEMLQQKTKALQLAVDQLKESYVKTMTTIVSILDAHEQNTATHSQVVSILSLKLAEKLGITAEEELNNIKYGALLHDVGKIAISDLILNKPGKLDEDEMAIIKAHPRKGYDIAKNIPFLDQAADIIYQHHERFDGNGYPNGLKGEEICIGARLFSVVDTFEAMRSSKRAYKGEISVADVIREINKCSGTQFDPKVVEAFNNCCDEINALFEKYNRMAADNNINQITEDFITQATF